ncbi:phage tail tape measure protein [Collimonas sp. NPDC087041]|uniref:phage tail tape measure protein n=1 Tax=Collimonas sp. NPDC087041 TaxID=3363960 RepID=UPI0038014126
MDESLGSIKLMVEADSSNLSAELVKSGQSVKQFETTATQSAGASATALASMGEAARQSADVMSAAQKRFVESLQRNVAAAEGGKIAGLELKAAQLGIADSAAPLLERLRQVEAAQKAANTAAGDLASGYTAAGGAAALFAESEQAAASRIKEMVSASVEKTKALQQEIEASRIAATASRSLGEVAQSSSSSIAAQNKHFQDTANQVNEVNAALSSIGKGASSFQRLQTQTDKLVSLWSQGRITAEQYDAAVKKLDASEAVLNKTTADATAKADQFIAKLKDQAATAGMSTKQLLEYRAAQLGVSGAATPFIEQIAAGEKAMHGFSLETGAARRELGVIIRELASGNFGGASRSFSIFAERSGLMTTLLSPVALGIGAVTAALGAFAVAAYLGHEEQTKLNNALILTGGYAGSTAGQLHSLAGDATAFGGSIGVAKDAVYQLADSGKFTSDQIGLIASAAVQMQDATGQAIDVTIGQFETLAKEPAKAIVELNDKYHFLTLSVYDQIVALEKQGDMQAAATLAEATYASALETRTAQIRSNQGSIMRGWADVKSAATSAWDAMLGIGRTETPEEKIGKILENYKYTVANNPNLAGSDIAKRYRERTIAQLTPLYGEKLAADKKAQEESDKAQAESAKISARNWLDNFNTEFATQAEKRQKEIDNYTGRANMLGVSGEDQAAAIAKINDKYKDKKTGKGRSNEYGLNSEIKDIQGQIQEQERALKRSTDAIKAQYDIGLLDTRQYLDQDYAARKEALSKEIVLADQQIEVAKQKKSGVALKEAQNLKKKLQDEETAADEKHLSDVTALGVKQANAVAAFSASLVASYQTRQQAVNNLIAGAGLGDAAKEELNRLNGVQQEFDKAAEALRASKEKGEAHGGISASTYDQELAILQANLDKRVEQERQATKDIRATQENGWNGATAAMDNYLDNAANVAAQTKSLFENSFKGMEDAIVNFAMTGKLNFADFAKSVIADMIRIQARAAVSGLLNFAVSAASSYFGGGTSYGGADGAQAATGGDFTLNPQFRAEGGPTDAGGLYRVNERGPELLTIGGNDYLMMGSQAGMVTSHEKSLAPVVAGLTGSGSASTAGVQVNVYVQSDGSSDVKAPDGLQQFGKELGEFVDARIGKAQRDSQRQGGSLWNMRNGVAA